jgi:hypothetical protein
MTSIPMPSGVWTGESARPARAPWIESPLFDLGFFILAPLVTLPIAIGTKFGVGILAALGVILAFPHYFSSLPFFFWDENRAYHKSRWIPFFAGPVLLAAVFGLMVAFRVPVIIQCAIFFWNTWHVSRQSCGILSLYRHKSGVNDPSQKRVANLAIISVSSWFALWNVGTNPEVVTFFRMIHPRFGQVLFAGLGVLAVLSILRLLVSLITRTRAGQPPTLAELAFIGTSLTLFYPYLLIRDSGTATFVILLPHYVQYLGIVWLLHRRRFGNAEERAADGGESAGQRAVAYLSTHTWLLVPVLFSIGAAFLAFYLVTRRTSHAMLYENIYLLVAFEHFYLDGYIWAFKQPHVRKTIGARLLGRRVQAA